MRSGITVLHRPARDRPTSVARSTTTVATPPVVPEAGSDPVWLVVAPLFGSLGMIAFAAALGDPRHLMLAGIMGGAMLISGIVSRKLAGRSARLARRRSVERYRDHLAAVRDDLDRSAGTQRTALEHLAPQPGRLPSVISRRSRIWERRGHHADFLFARLGTGSVEPDDRPVLDLPSDPTTELEPELLREATELVATTETLDDAPIVIDLDRMGCLALVGDRETTRSVARGILLHLATFCAPTDLAVSAWTDDPVATGWEWVKWLPHTRATRPGDEHRTLLTAGIEDLDLVLEQIIDPRVSALGRPDRGAPRWRRVLLIVDGYSPVAEIGRLGRLERALRHATEIELLCITLVGHRDEVPADAGTIVTVQPDGSIELAETAAGGCRTAGIRPDRVDLELCDRAARLLAPLRTDDVTVPAGLENVGLRELVGDGCDLPPLCTPIGIGTGGDPVLLDLREASSGGMGPHGVLIGSTGSGKSELLRTLVLGLADRHATDDLAFVLADFKGGATFAGLEALPHTAGSITNIESDLSLVDRMQAALFGEMERRQRTLRAGGFDRADEYRAHRLTHPDAELEPLPALLVVVDEFGELLAQRPDFVDLFAAIGRTGRSVGIHLLLSSQRLDESRIRRVESHLRYRICLRTFSADESRAVLGSPAAHELPAVPGLGYLSVDGDVSLFKGAIVSSPVRPVATGQARQDRRLRRFEFSGVTSEVGDLGPDDGSPAPATTEMRLMIDRIDGRAVRPVWLDPLPARLEFTGRELDHRLQITYGLHDLPSRQAQPAATMDFSGAAGNLAIVGSPRSGKSSMLGTIVAALAASSAPDDTHVYAIDLGGGTLHRYETLPHVGAVFGRAHRDEITRLVDSVHALIDRRAETFHQVGVTSIDGYLEARRHGEADDRWGEVFLVIDNWGRFAQDFAPEAIERVSDIASSGLHYGVHLVISACRWQDVKMSLRDQLGGRFELRLSDPNESEIDRRASQRLTGDIAGRGIDHEGRLTQVALPPDDLDRIGSRRPGTAGAPPIRSLPTLVMPSEVTPDLPTAIGMEEHTLSGWEPPLLDGSPHLLVVGDVEAGKTTMLRGLLRSLRCGPWERPRIAVVDPRGQLAGELASAGAVAHTPEETLALARRVAAELAGRRPGDHAASRFVLVVDDYDLVCSGTADPLAPIVDLIARGRDIGFHLVVARRLAGLGRSSFDPVLRGLRESGTPLFMMSGDPAEGFVVGDLRARIMPPGRGVLVQRGRTQAIQIARFPERSLPPLPRQVLA